MATEIREAAEKLAASIMADFAGAVEVIASNLETAFDKNDWPLVLSTAEALRTQAKAWREKVEQA